MDKNWKWKTYWNEFWWYRFCKWFKNKNLIVENKDFAIFGIGGAGTSICYSLIRAKARRLKLINRNTHKLNFLANKLKDLKSDTEILVDDIKDYNISEYDYVINATSLGLKDNKDLIFDVEKTKFDCTIVDIVMDPEETVLIKEAIKYNRNYHLGKNMFLTPKIGVYILDTNYLKMLMR